MTDLNNDNELAIAAKNGDIGAYEALIKRCFGLVFSLAYARLQNKEAAEDLTQEVFLRIHLNLEQYDASKSFTSWISRITRNLAVDWWRYNKARSHLTSQVSFEDVAFKVEDPNGTDIINDLEMQKRKQIIENSMYLLTPLQREIVLLHYVAALKKIEIAERLEISPSYVSHQMKKALSKIRKIAIPMIEGKQPFITASGKTFASTLAIPLVLSKMLSGTKSVLAAESSIQPFTEPVTALMIDGPFATKISDAYNSFFDLPEKATHGLAFSQVVLALIIKGLIPFIFFIALLIFFFNMFPPADTNRVLVAAQNSKPETKNTQIQKDMRREASNPYFEYVRAKNLQKENSDGISEYINPAYLRAEYYNSAWRTDCLITSLSIEGNEVEVTLSTTDPANFKAFLDENIRKGLNQKVEIKQDIKYRLENKIRIYTATYKLTF